MDLILAITFYLPAWHSHCTRDKTEDVLIHETSFLVRHDSPAGVTTCCDHYCWISQARIVVTRWKQFQAGDFLKKLTAKAKLPSFTVLVWCSDELAIHSYPLLRLLTQNVTKLGSALFCCCSLLRNNNMATNLQRFTSSYDLR